MAIVIQCTCGRRYRTKDESAGKRVQCPACSATISVPLQEPTHTASASGQAAATDYAVADKPPSSPATLGQTARACADVAPESDSAGPRCPACNGALNAEWNACPHCHLALSEGVCSACCREITVKKACSCGLRPVVRIRKTKQALCTNCGRSIPWRPARCVRCAMDFFIFNSPFGRLGGIDMDGMASRTDKQRIRSFRSLLGDMCEERDGRQGKWLGNFLLSAATGDVAGGAQRQADIGLGSITTQINRLKLLKHQFHKQTQYKWATTAEKCFNPYRLPYLILGALLILLVLSLILAAVR